MPKIFPVIVKKTVSSSSVPTSSWPDKVSYKSALSSLEVDQRTTFTVADPISGLFLPASEKSQVGDLYTAVGTIIETETVQATDMPSASLLPASEFFTSADSLTANPTVPEAASFGDGRGPETSVLTDTVRASDSPTLSLAPAAEAMSATDTYTSTLQVPEQTNLGDARGTTTTVVPETAQASDVAIVSLPSYPDQGDTWLDQASASTSHGSDTTILAKGASAVPGSDERRAYMYFDLTKFASLQGNASATNGLTLTFTASTSNGLLATTLTAQFRVGSTVPFTESTATWTGQSASLAAYGSLLATLTKSIATGAAASYVIGISPSQATTAISNGFLLVIFTTAGGAAPDTVTIASKESLTTGNRPTIALNLTR